MNSSSEQGRETNQRQKAFNRATLFSYGILLSCAILAYQIGTGSSLTAYANMDPRGSTLVAQSLLQHGTVRVDGYRLPQAPWLFQNKNGHVYSTYPLGTPLLILPFVAIALSNGQDMQNDKADFQLQKQIGAGTVVLFMLLAYFVLRGMVDPVISALLAAGWTIGSGVMSTMGAGLWSIDFAVVLESGVVFILVRYLTGQSSKLRPLLIGALLF